jgi:hypothetical protein
VGIVLSPTQATEFIFFITNLKLLETRGRGKMVLAIVANSRIKVCRAWV